MSEITWLRPEIDANATAAQIEGIARDQIAKILSAQGINRPDIADAFAARLMQIVKEWDSEEVIAIDATLGPDGGLPESLRLPLERAVSMLKARAALKIAKAFISAGTTGVVVAFENPPNR